MSGNGGEKKKKSALDDFLEMRRKHLRYLDVAIVHNMFTSIGIERPKFLIGIDSSKFRYYMSIEIGDRLDKFIIARDEFKNGEILKRIE